MTNIDLDAIEASISRISHKPARDTITALVARVRELEDAIERAMEECRKTGDYNAHAKHLHIRSARLLAVEVLHILGGGE
ncbi:hypothetical protein [Gordonia rubripertincta]|uniref:hypothetical protein n=1 Tax=Gordonia rubripertincta TaxID=36822 RepID=UPI0015FBC6EC|nr:hypothetical protein [Gordonia rubripertincta]QMU19334.1 hypothetical protein H3V45_14670 [Gordonia rubripertincta]